eukprot:TRINITY_DN6251_c0_g1_i7.p1 TRINITY_DN6251_c0_g1~~TRINITY_DN6251_c0_g1_i7.p1  ORF type:complete len:229 (+),score=62.47 TRINITY_DN6251_c0_g1_i7:738-1424(+)
MHPAFLEDQLERSLSNLGLQTLDLLYLHNAGESQLPLIGYDAFYKRLAQAFEFFESKVAAGKIKSYGMATWVVFRARPDEEKLYLPLEKVVEIAEKVGGKNHNLKYIQVPINIMMPEAFAQKWQETTSVDEKGVHRKQIVNLVSAARQLNVQVISSAPLLQGSMMQVPMPTDVFKCAHLGAKHLQFIRSTPAQALLTTLVGMKRNRHVKMNLEAVSYTHLTLPTIYSV